MLNFAGTCKPLAKAYTLLVVYTEATGRENPSNVGGQPPRAAFFVSVTPLRAFNHGGPGGAAFGLAGANVPVSHPRCRARHPSRENERRASETNVGGRTMRQSCLARTSGIAYRSQTPDSVRLLERMSTALLAAAKEQRKPAAIFQTGDAQNRPAALAPEEAAMPEVLACSEQTRYPLTANAGHLTPMASSVHERPRQTQNRQTLRIGGHSIGLADRALVELIDAAGKGRLYDLADALVLADQIEPRSLRYIAELLRFDAEKGYLHAEDLATWESHKARVSELLASVEVPQ